MLNRLAVLALLMAVLGFDKSPASTELSTRFNQANMFVVFLVFPDSTSTPVTYERLESRADVRVEFRCGNCGQSASGLAQVFRNSTLVPNINTCRGDLRGKIQINGSPYSEILITEDGKCVEFNGRAWALQVDVFSYLRREPLIGWKF